MEEERIKSALEIAMERISALPELTAEEIAAQKEKQFGPVGEALAARYLIGLLDKDELLRELEKRSPDQRPIVYRALLSSLCRTLQLEGDKTSARKALDGCRGIAPEKGSRIDNTEREYQETVREYEDAKRRQSEDIEASALRPLGISGSAVRCNPAENAHWLAELKKIRQEYEPRLDKIRTRLLAAVLC